MHTKRSLYCRVMMCLLLLLCSINISIQLSVFGIQSVQVVVRSLSLSADNESYVSGAGNDRSKSSLLRKNSQKVCDKNNILNVPYYLVGIVHVILLIILISEIYFHEQVNFLSLIKDSLIELKIRLDN